MTISLARIKDILRTEDVEGLIELGAPDDEYDSEAEAVAAALGGFGADPLREDDIVAVISAVWTKMFGLGAEDADKRMVAFRNLAQALLSAKDGQ